MTSGEMASVVAVIGLVLSMLGVTGIDSDMLNSAVNGVLSIITIGSALFAFYKHRQAVGAARSAGAVL